MSDGENNVAEQDTEEEVTDTGLAEKTKPQDEGKEQMETEESVDSAKSSPKKTPRKRKAETDQNGDGETKVEGGEEEEEDKEEEESSDEELVGLLDGPVKLMTGKRERKKTERLTFDTKKEVVETKFEVEEGRGTKLGDIPNVEFYISRTNSDNFRALYRFFFGRTGKTYDIKKNIRKFSGFTFDKGSPEYEKKESILVKYTMPGLKEICQWLDLDRKGTKDEIMERILNFCLNPEPSGRPLPQKKKKAKAVKKKGKKRKRKAGGGGDDAKKTKKAKKPKKKKKKKKSAEDGDEDENEEDAGDEEEEEEEEEETAEDEDGDNEEEEEEQPKKKKAKLDKPTPKKTPQKKKPEKKAATPKSPKKSPVKKATPKKTTPKKASIQITPKSIPKGKAKKLSIEDSDDSSDDEPLIRKAEPSEAQIEQTVKEFLDKANLELVTMKMVCKKVYDTYPNFNLTHKKDFIKATVRSIIS